MDPKSAGRVAAGAREALGGLASVQMQTARASGASPGWGLTLVAQSMSGSITAVEAASAREGGVAAEAVGQLAARKLLVSLARGGCVDAASLPVALILVACASEDVSKLRVAEALLTARPIVLLLRDIRTFLGVRFRLERSENKTVIVSAYGSGLKNIAATAL